MIFHLAGDRAVGSLHSGVLWRVSRDAHLATEESDALMLPQLQQVIVRTEALRERLVTGGIAAALAESALRRVSHAALELSPPIFHAHLSA